MSATNAEISILNETESIAKSRGIALQKLDNSCYAIRVDRRWVDSFILWPIIVCMVVPSVGFAGIALHAIITLWHKNPGLGIGIFLSFGFMAYLSAVVLVIFSRQAFRLWFPQIFEIDLSESLLTITRGPQPPRFYSLKEVVAVRFSHWYWCAGDNAALGLVKRGRHDEIEVFRNQLGYRRQHAEIEAIGRALAEIVNVPFTLDTSTRFF